MNISHEGGMVWYEAHGRRAVVSRNGGGYMVHSFWEGPRGKTYCGGHGEGSRGVSLEEATEMARRFVSGQPVPEELGGFEDNKPEEVVND